MNWKRSITVIVSILLFAAGVKMVIACADGPEPGDMYVSFFQNNINAQPQYQPFYYTDYSALYGNWYYAMPEDDTLPDANTTEWYNYCNKAVKRNDIDSFMKKYSYDQLKPSSKKRSNIPAEIKDNTFYEFLTESQNKELLDYVLYAKKCEPLNAAIEEVWDAASKTYKLPVVDTTQRSKLIAEGIAINKSTKNDFLKWRYAYQALRLAMYNKEYTATLVMYEKMIGKNTANNIMYPRCLALKAGALYHTHKKKTAAYLYSRVFDISDDMKRNSFQSFDWATDSMRISDVQVLCKNNHEKAVVVVMDGLNERGDEQFEGLKLMQRAFTLDPNVKGLDVIMTREINKAEQRYYSEREILERSFTSPFDNYFASDPVYAKKQKAEWKKAKSKYKAYLDNLNLFAQKMSKDKKTADKAFWYLASSYICFMEDKFNDAKKYMELAGKEKMNVHEQDVHDMIGMLCVVHKGARLTPETEAELLPGLKWIEKRSAQSYRFAKAYRDFMATVLTNKYMLQKDTVRALMCQARVTKDEKGDFIVSDDYTDIPGNLVENMSINKLHEVQNFVQKNNKTEFEAWLTYKTPYPVGLLKELEGTKYIREMNFEKAVAALSVVPKDILEEVELPDVLISHMQDGLRWNKSDSAKTYNKLEFAKKMLSLQQTLEKQPNNGRAAYQYANGLYNMSYYGRAHHAYDYYRSSSNSLAYYTNFRKDLPDHEKEYYGLDVALKYYLVALNNSSDHEIKARCAFLAAKCWQKNAVATKVSKDGWMERDDKTYYQHSIANPYFRQLYSEYRNTKSYNEAYGSCSYLRDYAGKQ